MLASSGNTSSPGSGTANEGYAGGNGIGGSPFIQGGGGGAAANATGSNSSTDGGVDGGTGIY